MVEVRLSEIIKPPIWRVCPTVDHVIAVPTVTSPPTFKVGVIVMDSRTEIVATATFIVAAIISVYVTEGTFTVVSRL